MEDIYTKRNGVHDLPHRHDFYTVLIIKKSKGVHKIDFNEYPLENLQIFFVAPGQVHQVMEDEMSYGYAMTFTTEFLVENDIRLAFINELNLFHDYGQSPPLNVPEIIFQKLEHFTEECYTLFNNHSNLKNLSIGAYLKLFLIECNNFCSIDLNIEETQNSSSNIIKGFKNLVNKHYKEEHSTSFYAEHLFINPDHLNRTVKDTIGSTAKDYIQSRIITEAKRLLFFSDISNKEVGFELGFNEPANFSAFFKKQVGIAPSNFKKSYENQ